MSSAIAQICSQMLLALSMRIRLAKFSLASSLYFLQIKIASKLMCSGYLTWTPVNVPDWFLHKCWLEIKFNFQLICRRKMKTVIKEVTLRKLRKKYKKDSPLGKKSLFFFFHVGYKGDHLRESTGLCGKIF